MSNPPGDPPKPEEGTVVIPAGQSGRRVEQDVEPPHDVWDEEATRVIDPPSPPPPASPSSGGENHDIWSGDRSDLPAGTVLGNYSVGKIIARGGLGAIYDGVNIHNPAERVAIKTILPEPGMSERFGRMLLDEANALMRVRHDAVVPYRTYGRITGTDEFYLVLEFIEGDTLNEFYRRRKLTEAELFSLARRLAAGLQASHEEGLIHRDVSPDNILLQDDQLDKATLIDFGIAKIGGAEDQPGTQFAGKLSYAAPEQFTPGGRIGPWTDVYSLALLLIAAARSKALPMGKTIEEAQAAREQVPKIDGVPPRLLAPLQRMLEPHPPDRPQSMGEVIKLLDVAQRGPAPVQAQASTPSPVAQPPTPTSAAVVPGRSGIRRSERPARRPNDGRRRSGGWLSAILALLIGGGVAGTLLLYEEQIFGKPKAASPASPSGPIAAAPPADTPPAAPIPSPQKPRSQQLAEIVAAVTQQISTVPCSLARVSGGDTGRAFTLRIHGIWPDASAVSAAAASAASSSGITPAMSGEVIEASLCPVAASLKPLAGRLTSPAISRPQPAGTADRAVSAVVVTKPEFPAVLLFEVSSAGVVVPLMDIGAGLASGSIARSSDGRSEIVLTPPSPDANVSQTLLIVVEAMQPLPASIAAPSGLSVAQWAAAVSTAPETTRLTLMPRDGIAANPLATPAGAPPSGPPLPVQITELPAVPPPFVPPMPVPLEPDLALNAVDGDLLARANALDCSMIRVEVMEGQSTLRGIWGKPADVQAFADALSQETSTSVTLAGAAISPRRCSQVNALKPFFAGTEPATLAPPQAMATGGSSALTISPDPAYPFSYVVWIDSANRVRGLIDLSDPASVSAAQSAGRLASTPSGGYTLVLPGYSPDPAADSGAIALVMSTQPLSAGAWPVSSSTTLKAWTAQLSAAGQAGRLRVDMVEYAQAPPS